MSSVAPAAEPLGATAAGAEEEYGGDAQDGGEGWGNGLVVNDRGINESEGVICVGRLERAKGLRSRVAAAKKDRGRVQGAAFIQRAEAIVACVI